MIILHPKNTHACYTLPIETAIIFHRQWVGCWLKNQALRMTNIQGEMTSEIAGERV